MHEWKSLCSTNIAMEYECGSFKRNSSVAPFSLFISFFFSFLFLFFFNFCVASLALSFYLSFVLFGIFCFVHFGIFSSLKGNTLCFTWIKRRSSHSIRSTQHKDKWKLSWYMQMYASASVVGYAMILARHVAIIGAKPTIMRLYDQAKACMTWRSSHEIVDVAWQCISERLWKCLNR